MGSLDGSSMAHPGAHAVWGPNLWLVCVDGQLRVSGDGRRQAMDVDSRDLQLLLTWSRQGVEPPEVSPELRDALRVRGWDPSSPDRSALGSMTEGAESDFEQRADSVPVLIRIVSGDAVTWDHGNGHLVTIRVDDLIRLAGHRRNGDEVTETAAGGDAAPAEHLAVPSRPSRSDVAEILEPPVGAGSVGRIARIRSGFGRKRGSVTPAGSVDQTVPVWFATCARGPDGSPLALGMVQSAIKAYDGGVLAERYEVQPIRVTAESVLADVVAADRPGVLMLSNYHWTVQQNLALAEAAKQLQPLTLTVFGGPSAPKYEGDARGFFEANPQVDVIVRGEGEITASELLSALDGDLAARERLSEVDGLTARVGQDLVRTPDRERMTDPNVIPSPYLTGLFDHLADMEGIWAIETNRGCPYGCTFCDWGSATLSRVRKFELDRVLGELEWLATHHVSSIFVADANFGMYERDVEIATRAADLRRRHQAPTSFMATFAKNTTKHTLPIVEILQRAGLHAEATLSFQTTDEATLRNVRRQNVKLKVYDEMTTDARHRGLPVLSDLMLGLPGMTLETLKTDFEHCMDGEVTGRVFGTLVLPNSPMNDPEYRELHGITTDSEMQLVATTSYSVADREEMIRFRDFWRVAEHFGALREVLRFARHETGSRAVDILWEIYGTALRAPDRFPLSSWFAISSRRHLTVPMAWRPFFDEIRTILAQRYGLEDSSALRTVLEVQEALLPSPGRRFPEVLSLQHDYVAYRHQEHSNGQRRRLGEFGAGELRIDDPEDKCRTELRDLDVHYTVEGNRWLIEEIGFMDDHNWELSSPLSRELRGAYLLRAELGETGSVHAD